ncbi:hypothetical protein [Actinoplanes awajinensis]|uniref:hypothetical protein n=1 Tax=Actinoplanes awajinensis TaxID=135946 RepID=UPI0012F847CE|nr:hypothetical protein [Actinoplanes awajinensis]
MSKMMKAMVGAAIVSGALLGSATVAQAAESALRYPSGCRSWIDSNKKWIHIECQGGTGAFRGVITCRKNSKDTVTKGLWTDPRSVGTMRCPADGSIAVKADFEIRN